MSRRYMDFVPAKTANKKAAVTSGAPRRVNVAGATKPATMTTKASKPKVVMPEPTATPRTRVVRRDVPKRTTVQKMSVEQGPMTQQRVVKGVARKSNDGLAMRGGSELGVIEDLSPKFVKTDVPKRPLSDGKESKGKPVAAEQLAEAKSKKFRGLFKSKATASKGKAQSEKVATAKKDTFVTPKSPFINQDKVMKRPLSKNVYQKQIVATSEESNNAPVTIIAKPEKESRAGLIVTIILTIILGAVAGSVAFLLLPK